MGIGVQPDAEHIHTLTSLQTKTDEKLAFAESDIALTIHIRTSLS